MPVGRSVLPWGMCVLLWRSDLTGPMCQLRLREGWKLFKGHCKWWHRQTETQVLAIRGSPLTPTGMWRQCRLVSAAPQPHCTGSWDPRNTCPPGAQGRKLSISSTLCSMGSSTGWAPRTGEDVFLMRNSLPSLMTDRVWITLTRGELYALFVPNNLFLALAHDLLIFTPQS